MTDFIHLRHKPPVDSPGGRELLVACPPMQSHVNLARIVRTAGCFGVQRMIVCGRPKIDRAIARDALEQVQLETHRTLPPVLERLKSQGYELVGLEQTTNSQTLYDFRFRPRTVLVIGHERLGITEDILQLLDQVVEIPIYGRPHALNAATAASIAIYEYCRQCRGAENAAAPVN
jgi:tRNA G18 (ribose-2'-O)-methylase SpoU